MLLLDLLDLKVMLVNQLDVRLNLGGGGGGRGGYRLNYKILLFRETFYFNKLHFKNHKREGVKVDIF